MRTLPPPAAHGIGEPPGTGALGCLRVSILARAIAGLAVGLAGLVLVAAADATVLDVAGVLLALAGWAVYWVASFRLVLARIRRRR